MSYESAYMSRTAGAENRVKSIQSWKTAKPKFTVEDNIANALANVKSQENRTTGQKFSLQPENKPQNTNGYNFNDVIDIVNPLHHVPIVGSVYRKLTGDSLHPASRIIGGSIYGGPIGAVTSTLASISEIQSGRDINDHALSLVTGKESPNSYKYKLATHAYKPDPDERTAGLHHTRPSPAVDTISFTAKESYMVDPVTSLSLTPMPERI